MAGSVSPLVVAVLCTAALGGELAVSRRWPRAQVQESSADAVDVAGGALLGVALAWWASALLFFSTTFEWDDLTYHAASVAWWLQTESLSPPPFTYQAYYPYNAELLSLWFALPTRSDAHVTLAVLLWALLLVGAGLCIAQRARQSMAMSAVAFACFLASPTVRDLGTSFSATDLCVAATALTALALAYVPEGDRSLSARALLCGIAAGYAVGTKISIAPVAALLGCWWLVIAYRARRPLVPALFVVGLLALGSGWYLRNWILAGNPLFPAEFGPFDGPFDVASQRKTSMLGVLQLRDTDRTWTRLVWQRFDWPYPLGIAAVFGYFAALVGAWFRERREAAYLLLVAGAGLAVLLLYPATPFSGTTNRPNANTHIMVRYLTFSFAVGLTLLPALIAPAWIPKSGWRIRVPRLRWWPAVLMIGLVGLAAATSARQAINADDVYRHDTSGGRVGPGWKALELLPDGARIASYSTLPGSHGFYYPLFGRRLQHEPVGVLPDGRPRGLLHETWRERPRRWWWEFDRIDKTGPRLVENLRAAGVTHVFVTRRKRKGRWPKQRTVIREKIGGAPLHAGEMWELWELPPRTLIAKPAAHLDPTLIEGSYDVRWSTEGEVAGVLTLDDGAYRWAGDASESAGHAFYFVEHPSGRYAATMAAKAANTRLSQLQAHAIVSTVTFDPEPGKDQSLEPRRTVLIRVDHERKVLYVHSVVSELETWRIERPY